MFVLINGPLGIGKTETSWELLALFERAVMLDGDYLGAVQPFDLHSPARVDYLYQTLRQAAGWHWQHGYRHFVINYVFEEPASAASLRRLLAELDPEVYTFRLVCAEDEIARRIRQRGAHLEPDLLEWELQRAKQLLSIQNANALHGDLGYLIDTTQLSARQAAGQIHAILHEAVQIEPYSPLWPQQFESERQQIAPALAGREARIEHVGSTAVPGLSAKPIIDILVSLPDLARGVECIPALAGLGYTFVDYPENSERLFFRKGFPRTHHLHIVQAGSREESEKLRFRDALRTDPALRAAYQALKQELAQTHRQARAHYAEQKTQFVRKVLYP